MEYGTYAKCIWNWQNFQLHHSSSEKINIRNIELEEALRLFRLKAI